MCHVYKSLRVGAWPVVSLGLAGIGGGLKKVFESIFSDSKTGFGLSGIGGGLSHLLIGVTGGAGYRFCQGEDGTSSSSLFSKESIRGGGNDGGGCDL